MRANLLISTTLASKYMRIRNLHMKNGFTPLEASRQRRLPRFRRGPLTGFTLIETIVYVALLGVLSVFVVNSFIQVDLYARARAEREALANARAVLELVTKNIAQSQSVYAPTSRFNADAGQLSLMSAATSTPGHTTSYIDFWMDGGVLMMRHEGQRALALSAGSVRVTKFHLERIVQAIGREAVRMTIRVDSASAKFPASVTLNATAAIRGNY